MTIQVNVSYAVDINDARRALTQLEQNLGHGSLERFMYDRVSPYLQARAAARFASEGDDAVGGPWTPLAAATLLIRAQQGYPTSPINVRTGQMKSFLTGSFGFVTLRGDITELEWPNQGNMGGLLERKIRTAQFGTLKPSTPPRPILAVGDADSMFITAELTAHAMAGL